MMLVLSVLVSTLGFLVLALGMARHRKVFKRPPISLKMERVYLYVGLLILLVPLVLNTVSMSVGSAIVWWCGQLSLSALIIVAIINAKQTKR